MIVIEYKDKRTTIETGQGCGKAPSTEGSDDQAVRQKAAEAYLSQVKEMNRMIVLKKSKIDIKREALAYRSPVMSDMPHSPSPNLQPMESAICDVLIMEDDLKEMEAAMAGLKARMMLMIEKLPSPDSQMVLIETFLNLHTNKQAGHILNYSPGRYSELKKQAVMEFTALLEQEGVLQQWIR